MHHLKPHVRMKEPPHGFTIVKQGTSSQMPADFPNNHYGDVHDKWRRAAASALSVFRKPAANYLHTQLNVKPALKVYSEIPRTV